MKKYVQLACIWAGLVALSLFGWYEQNHDYRIAAWLTEKVNAAIPAVCWALVAGVPIVYIVIAFRPKLTQLGQAQTAPASSLLTDARPVS